MQDILSQYPFYKEIDISWGEMDAMGHINNIYYFRYFESARIAYGEKINLWDHMKKTGIGPILKEIRCRYKIPLVFPDKIYSLARVTEVGEDFFVMEHAVYSLKHRKIAAEGKGTLVSYDYKNNKKASLPTDWIDGINSLEKSPP
ncbi:MAG: acyl-CoA thioesterase [Deltaproteobacteria bacterium]|nr:acyl-CoA thioesterase [Deltaproteobacteria bacterium]